MNRSKVLVLGDTLSALAVGRSLGRQDLHVIACIEDKDAPLRYSKYTRQVFVLPSYAGNPGEWVEALKKIVSLEKPDLLIPASESSFVPFCLNRDEFAGILNVAIPDKIGFETTYFKDKTIALAKTLGVLVPGSFLVKNNQDLEEFFRTRPFDPPFVVKTTISKAWQDGYKLEFSARRADAEDDVRRYVEDYLTFAPILVQQRFEGVGVGQEFLCKNGEVLLAFEHLRLREPEGSGGSSYRKSVPLDKRMLECSEKLLKRLQWTGVAMVEYRKNLDTEEFVLLEINGRFWGSLPLALEAGADFPYALYKLLVTSGSPTSRGKSDFQKLDYKIGVYCRDLMDDLRFVAKSHGFLAAFVNLVFAKIRFLFGLEKWDAFVWSDPWPGVMEFWFTLRSFFSLIFQGLLRTMQRAFFRRPRIGKLRELLAENRSMLFVCLGNVSRSPFAAEYFKKKLAEIDTPGVKINSAGLSPKVGRTSTPYVKFVAAEYGLDLAGHRSVVLNEEAVREYGLILCMDLGNYRDIERAFPYAKNKLFLLGSFNDSGVEIEDPRGGDPEVYRRACWMVKEAVDKLFSLKLIS